MFKTCGLQETRVVFLLFPSTNRKFSNIINAIMFKHCAEIKKGQGDINHM